MTAAPLVLGRLTAPQVLAVHTLIEQVTEADGTAPLSEHVLLHLPYGGDAEVCNFLVPDADAVLGYAHLDVTDAVAGSSAELAVAPAARGRGLGRALVQAALGGTPDGRLRLWAHGDLPAAAALAASMGFGRGRVLLQMRRSLVESPARTALPEGIVVRAFVPGEDEQAWTDLNNRAFIDHPDQGGWEVHEVQLREKEPWFDPEGFFLAERAGRLVGFHWTKVHGSPQPHSPAEGGPVEAHGHAPIGEVYILGVDPSEQGRGLGKALTTHGLRSLRQRGLDSVLLYVDEANTAAVNNYEALGFTRHAVDVMYSRA